MILSVTAAAAICGAEHRHANAAIAALLIMRSFRRCR
jgi:hypothetical protein